HPQTLPPSRPILPTKPHGRPKHRYLLITFQSSSTSIPKAISDLLPAIRPLRTTKKQIGTNSLKKLNFRFKTLQLLTMYTLQTNVSQTSYSLLISITSPKAESKS